jgi:hypothetical protein
MNPLITKLARTAAVFALAAVLLPAAHAAATIWNGPTTNFVQQAVAFGQPPQADVLIPGAVSLTRNGSKWLYNTNVEPAADFGTPSDTEWSFGALSDYASLTYQTFDSFRDGALNSVLTNGGPMVCHLINEDIYLSIKFTQWPHGGGLIKYTRTTPNAVAPPPTPTVDIIVPTNGTVFAAPADILISANASVSTGTVTNVTFFGNANILGSKQTGPFTITANGLGSGSYALKAVATAAGISATSSVVNISVVAPVSTSLSSPGATPDNQFTFSYSTTVGLRYEIEISSNLFNWKPLSTNLATAGTSFFTNPISGDGNYYRVGRLPNP